MNHHNNGRLESYLLMIELRCIDAMDSFIVPIKYSQVGNTFAQHLVANKSTIVINGRNNGRLENICDKLA